MTLAKVRMNFNAKMELEVSAEGSKNAKSSICRMCGTAYNKLTGYFYKSYAQLYKGNGYMPYCKNCVDNLYQNYLAQCKDQRLAIKQVCRKIDLYWNEMVYGIATRREDSRTVLAAYISAINVYKYSGKSYDDYLNEQEALWSHITDDVNDSSSVEFDEVSEEIKEMWGPGYTNSMYVELEQRWKYWIKKLKDEGVDVEPVGTQALLRQIVSMELDINKSRTAGDDVEKKVNTFKNLLSDAMLKPSQKSNDGDAVFDTTPLGVWIKRWEDKRPVPEPDPELQDVDGVVKYISVWFLGHLCKMLGIKNTYCKMYEDKIAEMRLERPEFDDEDDEDFVYSVFGNTDNTEESAEYGSYE